MRGASTENYRKEGEEDGYVPGGKSQRGINNCSSKSRSFPWNKGLFTNSQREWEDF